jgi:hypothetical protein
MQPGDLCGIIRGSTGASNESNQDIQADKWRIDRCGIHQCVVAD